MTHPRVRIDKTRDPGLTTLWVFELPHKPHMHAMAYPSIYILHNTRRRLLKIGKTSGSILDRAKAHERVRGGRWPLIFAARDPLPGNGLEAALHFHFDRFRVRGARGWPTEDFLAQPKVLNDILAWREGAAFRGLYPYHAFAFEPRWRERWLSWEKVRPHRDEASTEPTLRSLLSSESNDGTSNVGGGAVA